ncbi:hypothetical protein IUJ58_03995 [Priestia aryabhattai]|nr:hypothetical protein [Priestia aryabhattai]MBU3570262.1 hypothetical protein [Priestia aryabhattai]WDL88048.1 hypothetical protein IUJ58_03995 [Priestia aryabhattai]
MSKQNKSKNQGVSSSTATVDNVNKNILSNDIHTDELQKAKVSRHNK